MLPAGISLDSLSQHGNAALWLGISRCLIWISLTLTYDEESGRLALTLMSALPRERGRILSKLAHSFCTPPRENGPREYILCECKRPSVSSAPYV